VVGDIETVFMLAREEYGFASSTIIRQIAAGGRLDRLAHLLPPCVIDQLKRKISGEHPNLARFRDDLNKR
jgi:phosphopantetheine adenylyltransferase